MRGDAELLETTLHLFIKEPANRNVGIWVIPWTLPPNMCVTLCKLLILYVLSFLSVEKEKRKENSIV